MTVLLTLIMLNLRFCSFTNPPWTCAVTTLPVRLPLSGEGVGGYLKIFNILNIFNFKSAPAQSTRALGFNMLI